MKVAIITMAALILGSILVGSIVWYGNHRFIEGYAVGISETVLMFNGG